MDEKDKQRDLILDTAEKLTKAIEDTVGKGTKVGIFYIYLEPDTKLWISGDAGNMNWMERRGSLDFLTQISRMGDDGKIK